MRILQEETIAVVIDVQERLFPHIHERDLLEKNLTILIRGLQILGVPILVTQQYTKGLGPTIPSVREALGSDAFVEKVAFSCCGEPQFMADLAKSGKGCVVLAGIEAHVCVQQTALDLTEDGYTAVLIADCVSSRRESDKVLAMERIRTEGGVLASHESILFELCRAAGTDTFRAVSKLVK